MDNQAKFDAAVELLKAGKHTEALDIFNQLVELEPKNAYFLSERGVVHFHLKNKKQSLEDLDKALELEPHKPYRYSSRAYVLGHYGKIDAAIKDYEKAISLDPEDAIAHNNLGLLQEQLGYMEKSKGNFEKADELAGIVSNRGRANLDLEGEEIEARHIQKEIDEQRESQSFGREIMQVFTKSGFKSFTDFIKAGFKMPKES